MSLKNCNMEKYAHVVHKVEINPVELAGLFWEMNDVEMCEFFEAIGKLRYEYPDGFSTQMLSVATRKNMTPMMLYGISGITSILSFISENEHG